MLIPVAKIPPPIRHNRTLTKVALIGDMIGIIVKNSIPIPRERRIESQSLCFATTLARVKIATKIDTKKNFESIEQMMFLALIPSKVKGSPATAPPTIAPRKKKRSIEQPATNPTIIFEKI